MKRNALLALVAALLVALTATAVTAARDEPRGERTKASSDQTGSSDPVAREDGRRGGRDHGRRGGRGHGAKLLGGLADRLGVTRPQLVDGLRGAARRGLDRKVADGTITAAQRDALAACLQRPRGAGCDRRTARPAARALKRSFRRASPAALAQLKDEVAGDLAAELGKDKADVVAAIRAELADKLAKGVAFGVVSEKARDLALGCFDAPASCDRAALREALPRGHGHRRGHGRRGHRRD